MIAIIMRLTGLSRVLSIAALVAVAVLALGAGKCAYDRKIIAAHDAEQSAAIERAARKASDAATQNETIAADEFEAAQANITQGVDDAKRNGNSATGAYFDRLRAEQARRDHAAP